MKIKSVCVATALFASSFLSASAQSSAQLKAGVNLANVSVTEDGRVDDAKMHPSFQVGIIGDVPLAGSLLSLQPGLLFTGKGAKTETGNPNGSFYSKATSNPFYIEVPVNVVAKLPIGGGNRFFVGAGPYGAIGVAGKTKIESRTPVTTQHYEESIKFSDDDPTTFDTEEGAGFRILKRFDYGLNGIAGIEGKAIVLGVNYGLGLAKLQSGTDNENNKNKHRVLSVTLGFKL